MSFWQRITRKLQPKTPGGAWIEIEQRLRDNDLDSMSDLVADVLQSRGLRGKLTEPLLVEATPYQWGKSPQEYRAVVLNLIMSRLSIPDLKAMQGGESGVFGNFSGFPGAERDDEFAKQSRADASG